MNQLLPALLQHSADISRTSAAINHCLEVSKQMSPAELMAMIFQMAVGQIAIADNDAIEFFTEQVSGHGPRPRSAHGKERAEATHDRPQPGLASVHGKVNSVCRTHSINFKTNIDRPVW